MELLSTRVLIMYSSCMANLYIDVPEAAFSVDYSLKNDGMLSLSVVITAGNSTCDTIRMCDPSIAPIHCG